MKRLIWARGQLLERWTFVSDWKPEPSGSGLSGWEPVFQSALSADALYVPGSGGSIHRVNRDSGVESARIDPFHDSNTYVSGPLAIDAQGYVYYNALKLDPAAPWTADAAGAWLVKVAPDNTFTLASYQSLTPGAPEPASLCNGVFPGTVGPLLPPSATARPPQSRCGSQRPGVNIAPVIAPDGTVYSVSRAHLNSRYSYVVAANSDLSPKWIASLRDHLNDGCGVTLPAGTCRDGTSTGVDPQTNEAPAGRVNDLSSSSPVVAPDGSVLYGSFTLYNSSRGHLFHFSAGGIFQNSYDFGWDTTPAVFAHDGTYSVILKDNHYSEGPFYITRLNAALQPEWRFQNTNTLSCERMPDGWLDCVDNHPTGFEWCINAPAVDARGNVLANGEDGNLYVIGPDGSLITRVFLNLAIGAAYTPLSIGDDGRIYTENDGRLFVMGAGASPEPGSAGSRRSIRGPGSPPPVRTPGRTGSGRITRQIPALE